MSETKIKMNQIDFSGNTNEIDGEFHPRNNDELWNVLDNNNSGVIDFLNYQDNFDENGYEIENKNFIFKNLEINNFNQEGPYFIKPLFKFNNCNTIFVDCNFEIRDINLRNFESASSLIEANGYNGNENNLTTQFLRCNMDLNNFGSMPNNSVKVIELNDMKYNFKNCNFKLDGNLNLQRINLMSITDAPSGEFETGSKYYDSTDKKIYTATEDNTWDNAEVSDPEIDVIYEFDGQNYMWDSDNETLDETDPKLDYGTFVEVTISDQVDGSWKTNSNVEYSYISVSNFKERAFCIEYKDDRQTYMGINYSNFNAFFNGVGVQIPNNSSIDINFSNSGGITCIPTDISEFQEWIVGTTYHEGDLLVLIDSQDENNKEYFKVKVSEFTPTDDDFWDAINNDYIEFYYNTQINCIMSNVSDPYNLLSKNRNAIGMFETEYFSVRDNLNTNSLNTNNLNCNGINQFNIGMQDENINGGNDTDVLSAISELAARLSAIEQN